MFTSTFLLALLERAVKTFAQALVAVFATNASTLLNVDWAQALTVSGTAAILSVLTSIVSANIGNNGPSLASEALVTDPAPEVLQP